MHPKIPALNLPLAVIIASNYHPLLFLHLILLPAHCEVTDFRGIFPFIEKVRMPCVGRSKDMLFACVNVIVRITKKATV